MFDEQICDVQVVIPQELLTQRIAQLQSELNRVNDGASHENKKATAHSRTERRVVIAEDNEYHALKSNGIPKAQKADSIRSYDDFKAMQDYFLSNGKTRDWAMWTIGVGLGVRISDLLSLQYKNLINADGTYKDRIKIYEKKTGKLNDILITECVKDALSKYIESTGGKFDFDNFIFSSQKGHGTIPMAPEHGWRIISGAGKAIGLPIHVGSHTMRKSFANIAACVDKSVVDMNTITKVQGLLNHSDQHSTMRYLGTFKSMYDRARRAVSDFVLGKSTVNDLTAGQGRDMNDLYDRLEEFLEREEQENG